MIKQVYSKRLKGKVYRLDARPSHGKRFRKFFLRRSDAEAVAYKLKHDAIMGPFGLPTLLDRPLLCDLAKRFTGDIRNPREHKSYTLLSDFWQLLTPNTCVDEVKRADGKRYIDKRLMDGLKPQTVDRELNIIAAMLNKGDTYFPQLDQWRFPRLPRPKIVDGRRERVWSEHEIKVILGELFAPKLENELIRSAIARYHVGRKVQFSLLNGLGHSEMNLIPKTPIKLGLPSENQTRQDRQLQSYRPPRADFDGDSSRVLRRIENRSCVFTQRQYHAEVLPDSPRGLPTRRRTVRPKHSRRIGSSRRQAHGHNSSSGK